MLLQSPSNQAPHSNFNAISAFELTILQAGPWVMIRMQRVVEASKWRQVYSRNHCFSQQQHGSTLSSSRIPLRCHKSAHRPDPSKSEEDVVFSVWVACEVSLLLPAARSTLVIPSCLAAARAFCALPVGRLGNWSLEANPFFLFSFHLSTSFSSHARSYLTVTHLAHLPSCPSEKSSGRERGAHSTNRYPVACLSPSYLRL
jgi:hypothetical protein